MQIVTEKASPMGWFYQIDGNDNPQVYRCKIGQTWERPEIYEITEMSPAELRFLADLIDAHKDRIEEGRP